MKKKDLLIGPRGGKTTISKSGLIRKTFWLHPDEEHALRHAAFNQRRSEAELVREALRRYFELDD